MPRYRTEPHDAQAPFRDPGQAEGDGPELESVDTTYADDGNEIFFVSGYSAREISQRRHQENGGTIWVNSVSRKIVRHDYQYATNAPVYYAVHPSPIYTLIRRDGKVLRAYWPALGE
jgi:hypothetical protein